MVINKNLENDKLTISVEGRLDTVTAPELDGVLKNSLEGVAELIFDFDKLEYISSAGLRVILSAQKQMNKQGSMKVINSGEEIKEIFDVTGFTDIITIE